MAFAVTLLNWTESAPAPGAALGAAASEVGAGVADLRSVFSIALRKDGSDWARLPEFETGSVMAGSLSFLGQCPLLRVGHAQYRQLNLELEVNFHQKTKNLQTFLQ